MLYAFTISEGDVSEVVEIEADCRAQAWEYLLAMFDPFN